MKHNISLNPKLLYISLIFSTSIAIYSLAGFIIDNNKITNYYFYKDKPIELNLRTDKIFIKTKQVLKPDEMQSMLSQYPQIASLNKANTKEKMQFLDLLTPLSSAGLADLIKSLNQNSKIEFSSPVYSPLDGSGNKVLQGLTDEILVQFKPEISANNIKDYLINKNLSIIQTLDLTGGISYVLRVPEKNKSYSIDVANEVYESGLVNWSEPNFYYSGLLFDAPNDRFFPRQWSIKNTGNNIPEGVVGIAGCDMRVDSAWNITTGISQCIIGMVDSGIDTTHEDIKENLLTSLGYDIFNGHLYQTDEYGHGTCTGGIVGAVQNNTIGISGIAPKVKLMAVKVFDANGNATSASLANGVIYSYKKGGWISSNSWGGSSPISAIDMAIMDGVNLGRGGKGTVFCFAVGNSGGPLAWPSTNPNVIAIGGNTPCNTRKTTSSCDGENWWGANYGTGLHIVAPCVKIYTTDITGSHGYTLTNYDSTFNGTSAAAPNVAGVCALSLSLDSNQRWDTIRVRLCRTADKIGTYSYAGSGPLSALGNTWNLEMGYGKVNAYKLLKLTQQSMSPVITHTPLGNTEQTTGNISVNCTITASQTVINPGLTKLYYRMLPATTWSNVALSNTSGNNWSANLPLSGIGTYNYYLTTTDSLSRITTSPNGAPSNFYSLVAAPDTSKPVIAVASIPNTPKTSWPVSVSAVVTDNIGIDSVWVKWYKNNNTAIKQFKLINTSGSNFSAAFNSVQADVNFNDSIFYKVYAQDNSNGHYRDSSELFKFIITNQVSVCIGTGLAPTYYPFCTGVSDARTQMLYLASELIAGGGAKGNITRIGFNFYGVNPRTILGFNVKIKNTSASSINSFEETDFTTCFSGPYTVSGTGWKYISLITPFAWDGQSNVLVDVCFDDTTYADFSWVYGGDNPGKTVLMGNNIGPGCTFAVGTGVPNRPNICFGINLVAGAQNISSIIPEKFMLNQNYPNPFNPTTKIKFDVPTNGFTKIAIYDMLGREVKTLLNENLKAGTYEMEWNATNYASGIYFYKMTSGNFASIKKMVLIK